MEKENIILNSITHLIKVEPSWGYSSDEAQNYMEGYNDAINDAFEVVKKEFQKLKI